MVLAIVKILEEAACNWVNYMVTRRDDCTNRGSRDLAERVFNRHLFPELSPLPEDTIVEEQMPVIHTGTRKEMCNLILLLTQDLVKYEAMIDLVAELVAHGK
jgi:hypothetical protein